MTNTMLLVFAAITTSYDIPNVPTVNSGRDGKGKDTKSLKTWKTLKWELVNSGTYLTLWAYLLFSTILGRQLAMMTIRW